PKTRSRGRATVLPSDDVSDEPSGPADPTVAPEPVATRASDPAADDPVDDGPVTDDPAEGAATAGAVPSVIATRAGTAHAAAIRVLRDGDGIGPPGDDVDSDPSGAPT